MDLVAVDLDDVSDIVAYFGGLIVLLRMLLIWMVLQTLLLLIWTLLWTLIRMLLRTLLLLIQMLFRTLLRGCFGRCVLLLLVFVAGDTSCGRFD